MKPSIGRIVHYVQPKPAWAGQYAGEVHLPAIVVAVWSDTCVNLQVFTDGTNSDEQNMSPVKWMTSVNFDGSDTPQPRSWHWPEIDYPGTPVEKVQIAVPQAVQVPVTEPVPEPSDATIINIPQPTVATPIAEAKPEATATSAVPPHAEATAEEVHATAAAEPKVEILPGYEIAGQQSKS